MRSKLQQAGLVFIGLVAGILVSVNFSAVAQKDVQTPLPIEELRSFADVFNAIKQGYVEPIEDKKLITHAISGMLSNLDPHSSYLDPDAFKDLQVSTQGEFGGLGIEVGMEDGFVKVVSPIEDTPAHRAGIKAGDLIIKLDETPVKGMTLNDAVKKMRGKPKTSIKLTVARKGEGKPLEFTIVRDKIKVQSVKSKTLEPGYAYVRITQFQEETIPDLAKHLDKLFRPAPPAAEAKGKEAKSKDAKADAEAKPEEIKGLVLDLRNDPGGLLHGAIGVAAAFLPPKVVVVSTDGRTEDAKRKYIASTEDYQRGQKEDILKNLPPAVKTVPLVVLVNGGSASASEIVAGALQDHKRAVVMGTQTFGKGSVQTILPLSNNSAIKLTTARYYTPNGRSIQAEGIVPDIELDNVRVAEAEEAPFDPIKEADLSRHLQNGNAKEKPAAEPAKDSKEQKSESLARTDYQLYEALNLLKGLAIQQERAK